MTTASSEPCVSLNQLQAEPTPPLESPLQRLVASASGNSCRDKDAPKIADINFVLGAKTMDPVKMSESPPKTVIPPPVAPLRKSAVTEQPPVGAVPRTPPAESVKVVHQRPGAAPAVNRDSASKPETTEDAVELLQGLKNRHNGDKPQPQAFSRSSGCPFPGMLQAWQSEPPIMPPLPLPSHADTRGQLVNQAIQEGPGFPADPAQQPKSDYAVGAIVVPASRRAEYEARFRDVRDCANQTHHLVLNRIAPKPQADMLVDVSRRLGNVLLFMDQISHASSSSGKLPYAQAPQQPLHPQPLQSQAPPSYVYGAHPPGVMPMPARNGLGYFIPGNMAHMPRYTPIVDAPVPVAPMGPYNAHAAPFMYSNPPHPQAGPPNDQPFRRRKRFRSEEVSQCHECGTFETPEWRRGPDGARTLCNACGLHHAKITRRQNQKSEEPHGHRKSYSK